MWVTFFAGRVFGTSAIDRRVRLEAEALTMAGHRVSLFSGTYAGDDPAEHGLPTEEVQTVRLDSGLAGRHGVSQELRYMAACSRALRRLGRGSTPDLIVSHFSAASFGTSRWARRRSVPTIFVAHALLRDRIRAEANQNRAPTTALTLASERWAITHSSVVHAVSRSLAGSLVEEGADERRVQVAYNPVDVDRFAPAPGTERDIDILFVGRLSPEKGIRVLVDAAERHLPSDLRAVVVGGGTLRSELERRAQGRGCQLTFVGAVANEEVTRWYQRAKLVVMPSLSDAQPVVLLEAMACGVPVVASAVGGIPEILVDGQTGWLIPPGDPAALAAKILEANGSADVDGFGLRARGAALSFSVEEFRRRTVRSYELIASGGT